MMAGRFIHKSKLSPYQQPSETNTTQPVTSGAHGSQYKCLAAEEPIIGPTDPILSLTLTVVGAKANPFGTFSVR